MREECGEIRACVNRSWSADGPAFPAIVSPGFPDESPHDDDYVGKGDPEVDHSPFPLGAPEEFLVGVGPGIGPFDDPAFRGPERGRFALPGDHAHQANTLQKPPGEGFES
jgi:hypothetical protein